MGRYYPSYFTWYLAPELPFGPDDSGRPWVWRFPLWGSEWSGYRIYRTSLLLQSTSSTCLPPEGHQAPQVEKRQGQKQNRGLVGNSSCPKGTSSHMWKGRTSLKCSLRIETKHNISSDVQQCRIVGEITGFRLILHYLKLMSVVVFAVSEVFIVTRENIINCITTFYLLFNTHVASEEFYPI